MVWGERGDKGAKLESQSCSSCATVIKQHEFSIHPDRKTDPRVRFSRQQKSMTPISGCNITNSDQFSQVCGETISRDIIAKTGYSYTGTSQRQDPFLAKESSVFGPRRSEFWYMTLTLQRASRSSTVSCSASNSTSSTDES